MIETEPTCADERRAVHLSPKQLSNNKAPGVDEIPADIWKATGEKGVTLLEALCQDLDVKIMAYKD